MNGGRFKRGCRPARLAEHLDLLARAAAQQAAGGCDVGGRADEGQGEAVHAVAQPETNDVLLVARRDGGQVHHHARQIHVLALAQGGGALAARGDGARGRIGGKDAQHERAVGDQHARAGAHVPRQLLVRHGDCVTGRRVGGCEGARRGREAETSRIKHPPPRCPVAHCGRRRPPRYSRR